MSEPQTGRIGGGVLKDNLERQGVNLNFANVQADITADRPLLQLDVNNLKIGINKLAGSDTLELLSTFGATNLESTYANIADFNLANSEISLTSGNINLNAANNIFATAIATDDLKIDFNTISTTTPNTNIEIRPNATGNLNIQSNWNITGNLHATGDITFGGDLTLGNDNADSVLFAADVNSDIVPDQTNTSALGSVSKQWLNIYSNFLNGLAVEIDELVVGSQGSSLARRQGNIFYVSTLGSDTNVGDHQHGAFRTLKHALAQSDGSTAGPTVIHVYPGVYEEEFPLTVPSHVDIVGEDLRNTIIKPTVATQSNDAFYLEDDVTIENITIKDFYNGYAFRFTPGGLVNTRSPYIRNVTVITKGTEYAPPINWLAVGTYIQRLSGFFNDAVNGPLEPFLTTQSPSGYLYGDLNNTRSNPFLPYYAEFGAEITSADAVIAYNIHNGTQTYGPGTWIYDEFIPALNALYMSDKNTYAEFFEEVHPDPRFFESGDAGKGALIDGAVLDSASLEASMLFHSVTFITPGVDCITMTNGVRVEWLNSFTYFANRGLYATQGASGKLMPDASIRYGAELRAIGSASVYGNYGAVADGANTLMYLVGQNFAYIGAGKDSSNDNTLTRQSQETIELNSGSIVYTSTDATGTFRVGDNFFVDFETGTTSIDSSAVDFSGIGNITVNDGLERTYIDGSRVDTGNVRFSGNTVTTIDGDLNLSPSTEIFNTDNNATLIISRGTDLQRNNEIADFRYNTNSNLFEGYSTGNLSFGGIYSSNRLTSIDAHNTNNTIILRVSGVQVGSIDFNSTNLHGLSTGDILFDNNAINTTLSNSDLEFRRTTAANVVDVFDVNIKESNLSNSSNNLLTVRSTGLGYVKFDSTTGVVVPYGTAAERTVAPAIGETRYNTESGYLETWTGTEWQRSAGAGEEVTDVILKELVDLYVLVLG